MPPRSILTLGPLIVDIITSPMERMLRSGEGVATSVGAVTKENIDLLLQCQEADVRSSLRKESL